jgi:predicted ATP-dependent protease
VAELDPSIPLHGLLINRNDENLKQQRLQEGQMQMQQVRAEQDKQRRLADLVPQAMQGDQAAMQQVAGLDPQLYARLDEAQKASVKAQFDDMGAAVRWSMQDPSQRAQRWNQVVDYYGQKHPEVAQYRDHPEMAEQALMQLGQMGEYLKGQAKNDGTTLQRNYEFLKGQNPQLADQYLRNQAEGSPLIASNGDGTFTIIPRGMAGGQNPVQGAFPPPPPGYVIDEGGATGSAPSGNFP